MNTFITEKTDKGEVSYDVFSKLVDNRVLFLTNYIDDNIASDMVATLLYLDYQDDKRKISIYINSDGGDIESIFMIYDIMKMLKSPIETFCIGFARGESALILAAGTKGMRYSTKNSFICIHQLNHSHSAQSDMTKAGILLNQSKKNNERFLNALKECTDKSIKSLSKDTERDFYMIPEQAKKYRLIDHIIGQDEKNRK